MIHAHKMFEVFGTSSFRTTSDWPKLRLSI